MRSTVQYFLNHVHFLTVAPVIADQLFWGRDFEECFANFNATWTSILAADPNASYNVLESGSTWVNLDKAQIFPLLVATGAIGVPPGSYTTQDKMPDWKPSRDDKTYNPGTGTASDHHGFITHGTGSRSTFNTLAGLMNVLEAELAQLLNIAQVGSIPRQVKQLKAEINALNEIIRNLLAKKITDDEALAEAFAVIKLP